MPVLLLGATGCVGSAIFESLNEHEILAPSSYELDITNLTSLKKYLIDNDVNIIINCSLASSYMDDFSVFNINSLGSINIVKLSKELNIKKFFQISSIFTLSDSKSEYFSSYGLSKLIADEYIDMINRSSSCQYYILRCSQIIESENLERQGFIKHVLNRLIKNEDIILYGNHDPERNFITTETVCKTIEYLLDKDSSKEPSCVYNVINPKTRTLTETIQWFSELYGRKANIVFDEDKDNILDYIIPMPDERIMAVLGNSNTLLAQEILKYNEIYNEKN